MVDTLTSTIDVKQRAIARVRFVGIDLARFVAIVGMIAAHLVAFYWLDPAGQSFEAEGIEGEASRFIMYLVNGTAAPLFAVLGGVSLVFATRSYLRKGEERRAAAVGAIALRGVILIVVGLLLSIMEAQVEVVLVYFGVSMIIAAVFILLRSWVVITVAAVVGIAGGPFNSFVRSGIFSDPLQSDRINFETVFTATSDSLRGVVLTGIYPAITWVVYMLVGIVLARALIKASERERLARFAATIAGIGAVTATMAQLLSHYVAYNTDKFGLQTPEGVDESQFHALTWLPFQGAGVSPELWAQLIATPHSGTVVDMLFTVGVAFAVIGVLVWACDGRSSATLRATPGVGARMLDVLRSAGASPLTIYALHILAIEIVTTIGAIDHPEILEPGAQLPWWMMSFTVFYFHLAGVLLVGATLSVLGKRGPLETLLSKIVKLATLPRRSPRQH